MTCLCTRYQACDITLAGLSAIRAADQLGQTIPIYQRGWRTKCVDRAFDNRVSSLAFTKWATSHELIIWTEAIPEDLLDQFHRLHIHNYLYTSWDKLTYEHKQLLPKYSKVVLPSYAQDQLVKSYFDITNTCVVPFSPHLPAIRKHKTSVDKITVLLPLYGSSAYRIGSAVLLALAEICTNNANVNVVTSMAKGLTLKVQKDLATLSAHFEARWHNIVDCSWQDTLLLINSSDLLLWPSKYDNFVAIPITALHLGVPVVGFNIPPLNEFVTDGVNGLLIPGDVDHNWLGVPAVCSGYDLFGRKLDKLLAEPKLIDKLKAGTSKGLPDVDKRHLEGWRNLLPSA